MGLPGDDLWYYRCPRCAGWISSRWSLALRLKQFFHVVFCLGP